MLVRQMPEVIKVGRSKKDHKTLYFMSLPELKEWPVGLRLPSKHFALFLAVDARGTPRAAFKTVGESLVKQGIANLVVWGPDCCRCVHIPFAEDVAFKLDPDGPNESSINHDCYSGTLKEALRMFVRWGEVQSRYKRTCRTWLAVAVGNNAWAQSIRRSLGAYTRSSI
jgi:hypothetical protein